MLLKEEFWLIFKLHEFWLLPSPSNCCLVSLNERKEKKFFPSIANNEIQNFFDKRFRHAFLRIFIFLFIFFLRYFFDSWWCTEKWDLKTKTAIVFFLFAARRKHMKKEKKEEEIKVFLHLPFMALLKWRRNEQNSRSFVHKFMSRCLRRNI